MAISLGVPLSKVRPYNHVKKESLLEPDESEAEQVLFGAFTQVKDDTPRSSLLLVLM
jgi:hypothetical protein